MWFYARLKGSTSKEVKNEMEQMIKDVGLPHKRKEMSANLSGKNGLTLSPIQQIRSSCLCKHLAEIWKFSTNESMHHFFQKSPVAKVFVCGITLLVWSLTWQHTFQ